MLRLATFLISGILLLAAPALAPSASAAYANVRQLYTDCSAGAGSREGVEAVLRCEDFIRGVMQVWLQRQPNLQMSEAFICYRSAERESWRRYGGEAYRFLDYWDDRGAHLAGGYGITATEAVMEFLTRSGFAICRAGLDGLPR